MEEIFKKIGNLCIKENVSIDFLFSLTILTIRVYNPINNHLDCISINWDWSEESIISAINDTIRRVKE